MRFCTKILLLILLLPPPLAASDFEDYLPFYPNSGMLNVKDFGAKGDGLTDDLPAVKQALEKALADNGRYSRPPFIYFPAGTYLMGDSLEGRVSNSWSKGWRSGVMFMGEKRSTVTIKIQDNHPKFQDPTKPRPVIITGSEDPRGYGGGNQGFRQNIFNLTVDTGKGNPGAVGIDYLTNNRGTIRNVTVRSGDGQGATGISMDREWPGPGLIKNVRIEGFNAGITTRHHGQYSMTLENITLVGQNKVGIDNGHNGLFIQNLVSDNKVPALRQTGNSGLTVLVDGTLKGGADGAAIENNGPMLLRNLNVTGYGKAVESKVKDSEDSAPAGQLSEWISEKAVGKGNGKTLGLPVKSSPEFVSDNPADWQNAAEFIVEGEDPTAAIQKALNAGKPVVYFPNGGYKISQTLIVPPHVRKITGCQAALSGDKDKLTNRVLLQVTGGTEPLIIEHFWFSKGTEKGEPSANNMRVVQDSTRPVVFRHVDLHGGYANTAGGTGDVFFEDIMGTPLRVEHPQSVWGRQVNCEFLHDAPMIFNQGGNVWLLGYKTEGQQIILESQAGSVELLGGIAYALGKEGQNYDRLPMFKLANTQASLSLVGNGNEWITVIDQPGATLTSKDLPKRGRASKMLLYRN